MNRPAFQRLLILLLAAVVFVAMLGRKDVVTSHEARVAQTARIMAVSGWPWDAKPVSVPVMRMVETNGEKSLEPDWSRGPMEVNPWVTPVINHELRLQKPPLPYWCAAMVFRFAGVGEWQARFFPALLGAIATLLVWDLARMLLGRRAGMIAAGVWISTHFIVDEFRKSMADPFLAFFTLMCVWAWVRVSFSPRACSRGNGEHREQARGLNGGWVVVFYLSLALGALAKGPVILVTVIIPLIALQVLRRGRVETWWAHLIGLAIFLAIVVPWPLYIIRHVPNALDIWRYESVGEVTGENVEKARPWWMYIGNSFQLPLPWTPLWVAGIALAFLHGWRGIRGPRGRRRMFAIAWQFLVVLFFSFAAVKKPAYLLPAMAGQTLIVTDALLMLLSFSRRTKFRAMPGVLATAQALVGVGFSLGLSVVMLKTFTSRTIAIGCGGVATIAAMFAFFPIAKRSATHWLVSQVFAYTVILVVLLGIQRPDEENRRSSRAFAPEVVKHVTKTRLPLIMHTLPEDLAFYLPLDLPDAQDSPYALMAIDHSRKDPPETLESLSALLSGCKVIEARRIDLGANDGNGRWRLFEVTVTRLTLRI